MEKPTMTIFDGIKKVMTDSTYLLVFGYLLVGFIFLFFITWNFAYIPSFAIRWENWTPLNLFFWGALSFLSALVLTLEIYNIKKRIGAAKGRGILAVIPTLFISGCPTCAPLIFALATSSLAVGWALAAYGLLIQILTTILLSITCLYISYALGKCKTCQIEDNQPEP